MKTLDWLHDYALWGFGAVAALGTWVVRNVFTNQRKVELLESELRHTNKAIDEIKEGQKVILNELMSKPRRRAQ